MTAIEDQVEKKTRNKIIIVKIVQDLIIKPRIISIMRRREEKTEHMIEKRSIYFFQTLSINKVKKRSLLL